MVASLSPARRIRARRLGLSAPAAVLGLFAAAGMLPAAAARADWPAAELGELAHWDAAYYSATGARFIPFQLIVPGRWDGARRIDTPKVDFFDRDQDHWTGPAEETSAITGKPMLAYGRTRSNKREGTIMVYRKRLDSKPADEA